MGRTCSQCDDTFNIGLVGDLVISGTTMRQKLGGSTRAALGCFGTFLPRLQKSDAVFANFSGSIFQHSRPREKMLFHHFTLGYTHRQAAFLSELHHNLVLSVSNNNIADYRREGIQETIDYLNEHHIRHAGAGASVESAVCFTRVKAATVALAAFTDLLPARFYMTRDTSGISRATVQSIKGAIAHARQNADLVFASLHTVNDIHAPARFLPDSHQKQLAAVAVDAGADVVFGHHPHRLQAFGTLNGAPVFHSLGPLLYDPALSSIVHKSSPLYDSVQVSGGGMAILQCCKHAVRSARVFPTRTIRQSDGNFLVSPASLLQRARVGIYAAVGM